MTVAQLNFKPRSIGELLDQGIRLYRKNFLKFIGIMAIVYIPLTLLQSLVSASTVGNQLQRFSVTPSADPSDLFTPSYFAGIGLSILLGLLSVILVSGVATAAMTRAVADNYLGQPTGILDAYRRIGRSWISLIGALLLVLLISIPVFIWLIIPCLGWLTGPGALVFLWWMVVPLAAPSVVLENLTAGQAFRRAWDLARRRFWWLIGFMVILYLFGQIVVTGPVLLLSFLSQSSLQRQLLEGAAANQYTLQLIIQSLLGMVLGLLYTPLQATCVTLAYFDLRVLTEGLDLAVLSSQAGEGSQDLAEVTAQAPSATPGRLLTWTEVGYFALLSLGIGALYLVLVFLVFGLIMSGTILSMNGLP